MKVSLDIQGWQELDAAFRQAPDIVREELLAAVTEADELLEREVKDLMFQSGAIATGKSRASIFSREQVLPDGGIGVVGTAQPHVVYVELGTKPHKVSAAGVQAIEDWVRTKLKPPEKEVRGVAYVIARKIRQKGTQPVGMFSKTWAAQRPQVERIFAAARDRIVARIGGTA